MKTNTLLVVAMAFACAGSWVHAQQLDVQSGLQLWLKADAGVTAGAEGEVSAWADQSGKGHDALPFDLASSPALVNEAIAGMPAVRFDGDNDYLEVFPTQDLVMEGDISSWFVVKVDDFATYRAIWAKTSGNLPAPTDFYALPDSGIPRVFRGDGTFNSLANVDGLRPLQAGSFMVVGFEMSGTTMTHFLNGQENGSGQITGIATDLFSPLRIGTRDDFVTRLKGDLAELLIYNRALTDVERGEVNGYLKARYGLENDPPIASITSPETGLSVEAQGTVVVQVEASDADGRVASVQLFANGRAVSTAVAPPYSFPLAFRSPGEVVLKVVATDNSGATGDSESIVVTVTGEADGELTVIDNLQLWLRADAGVTQAAGGGVTLWEDQSGNGNHAVALDAQGEPAWIEETSTGQPAIQFDGVDDFLEVVSAPGIENVGDIASFFVVRFDDLATFRAVWGKTDGNQPRSTDFYMLPGSGLPRVYRGSPDGIGEVTGSSGVAAGQFAVVGFNMAGNAVTHFMNGQPNGSGVLNAPLGDAAKPLRIGTRDDFGTRMKGDIAELLIYDAALDSEEIEAVLFYLASKYSLPVVSAANQAPEVAVTSPLSGDIEVPATLSIGASVEDVDGSVVEVSYFANGQLLSRSTTPPFVQGLRIDTGGTIVLTVTARDNLGAVATSDPVTLNAIGGAVGDLGIRDGLQLWLSADAGISTGAGEPVLGWSDQSGNANDAYQFTALNGPVLVADAVAGRPVVRFDGVESFMTVNTVPGLGLISDLTSLFLVKFDDFATFRAVWTKTLGNQPRPLDYYLQSGSGVPVVLRGGSEGNATVAGAGAVPANTYVVLGFSQNGTTMTHYLNGRSFGTGEVNVLLEDFFMPLLIGTRDDFGTRFKGDIAELLIYDRALSVEELRDVATYLGSRYGVSIFEPVTNEVVEAPALTAAWDGDMLILSWTAPDGAFYLQQNGVLTSESEGWDDVTGEVVHEGGVNRVSVSPGVGILFFRLR